MGCSMTPDQRAARVRYGVTQPGDIWHLRGQGQHEVLCADNGDAALIQHWFRCGQSDLLVTSPPYAQQRDYHSKIASWTTMMQRMMLAAPMRDAAQVLVNLGLVHVEGEVMDYWRDWLLWLSCRGWKRFGQYVWDQGPGMMGNWGGRLAPSFEFVFHLNKASRLPNKIIAKKPASIKIKRLKDGSPAAGMRGKDGITKRLANPEACLQPTKIPDSVIRVNRHMGRGIECEHPAVMALGLVSLLIEAYSDPGDVVYEPFGGAGTTLLAAEQAGRRAMTVELSPRYVDLIVQRFVAEIPGAATYLDRTGETWAQAADRLPETV